jgi:hypothetical protein
MVLHGSVAWQILPYDEAGVCEVAIEKGKCTSQIILLHQ